MKLATRTGLLVLLFAAPATMVVARQAAQPSTPTVSIAELKKALGNPETITATVAAVDYDQRVVVLRTESGMDRALYVGEQVAKFKNIKTGDRLTVTYYMSLALQLLQPGQAPGPTTAGALVGTTGDTTRPGGTAAEQVRWVVTVNEIDLPNQTATVTGEKGRRVIVKAENKQRLAQLKPNDRIEVVLTAAVLVSMAPAK